MIEGKYRLYTDGDIIIDEGKYIVTWVKVDGRWLINGDIWNTNYPAFSGMKLLLLKGDRGEYKGKYGEIICIKSLEERDHWIPEPSKMSDTGKQAMEKFQPYQDKLDEMLTSKSKFTDWIILY